MDNQTDKKIEEVLYEERYRKTNRQILGTFDYENLLNIFILNEFSVFFFDWLCRMGSNYDYVLGGRYAYLSMYNRILYF